MEFLEEFVEVEEGGERGFVGANKLSYTAGFFGGKTFFEVVDAVVFGTWIGKTVDAVEIVTLETLIGCEFDHVPLD